MHKQVHTKPKSYHHSPLTCIGQTIRLSSLQSPLKVIAPCCPLFVAVRECRDGVKGYAKMLQELKRAIKIQSALRHRDGPYAVLGQESNQRNVRKVKEMQQDVGRRKRL
jgi:hypothetical protein